MKKLLFLTIAISIFLFAGRSARAQEYLRPQWDNCIRPFYDANTYNWLAFENGCDLNLVVVFLWRNAPHGGGELELAGGRHGSTGMSRKEVNERGGYMYYVCPSGYIPVDPQTGRYVGRPIESYTCRKN
jgi:hypothetical protein